MAISPKTEQVFAQLKQVEARDSNGILTVTLNRPEKRNAMSIELTWEMVGLLEAVALDDAIRVVILKGAGAGFCAGMDIRDFFDLSQRDEAAILRAREASNRWRVELLRKLPQPTIAMVHGFCFGGAFGIVEACDIAFAADDTKFALSEINFGHFPAGPVAKSISRAMSVKTASYYALSGRTFDGAEAERTGIISRCVPAAQLEAETLKLAEELVRKNPAALQFTKDSLRHVESMDWEAALEYNAAKFVELKSRQSGPGSRVESVASFLDGKSRPGLGT